MLVHGRSQFRVLQQSPVSGSRSMYFHPQLQSCVPDLILKSQPHELRFILTKRHGEPCGPLQANGAPPVFDVTQVHPRDAEPLRELGQAVALAFREETTRHHQTSADRP